MQGNESSLFQSYFKDSINGKKVGGLQYIPGGVASGFHHVEGKDFKPRLLEVKGKRVARVKEVPLQASSLTQGDAYVLDLGLEIFIFVGPQANSAEKLKATEIACHIDDEERGGKAAIHRIEDDPMNATFWSTLGGYVDPMTLPLGLPDADTAGNFVHKLFMISDASGSVQFTEIQSDGKLARSMLKSEDVFLLHTLDCIYIWVGRASTLTEKREAMPRALEYMKRERIPTDTRVQRIPEGLEPGAFIKEFTSWKEEKLPMRTTTASTEDKIAVDTVVARQAQDTVEEDFAAASEKVEIWRIQDFKAMPEKTELYGQFFSGDSYIILYTFKRTVSSKEESIIYFWLGLNSSTDEKGAAALLTKDLDDRMGGSPVQCRVVQGKEPVHFRRLFKGKMIVHEGGVPSGFRSIDGSAGDAEESGTVRLYAIHGTTPLSTAAIQVKAVAASINSSDCFLLLTPESTFLFKGKNSTQQEQNMAESVALTLGGKDSQIVHVLEGNEPPAFWTTLGGKADYPDRGLEEEPARDPRLFLASTQTGHFRIEEIDNFDQSDLCDEDVMLLDTYHEVFVWVGSRATAEEVRLSKQFAVEYIQSAAKKDNRALSTPVTSVESGKEPAIFTYHFIGWDDEFFAKRVFVDPYEAKKAKLAAAALEAKEPKDARAGLKSVSSALTPEIPSVDGLKIQTSPKGGAHLPIPVKTASQNTAIASVKSTYDTGKLPPMLASKLEAKPVEVSAVSSDEISEDMFLPYETLRDTKKPVGVEVDHKEKYLADDVFLQLFKMDKAAFAALPKWKRDTQKKSLGLF